MRIPLRTLLLLVAALVPPTTSAEEGAGAPPTDFQGTICRLPVKQRPAQEDLDRAAQAGGSFVRFVPDELTKAVYVLGAPVMVEEALKALKPLADTARLEGDVPDPASEENAPPRPEVRVEVLRQADPDAVTRLVREAISKDVTAVFLPRTRAIAFEGKPRAVERAAVLAAQLDRDRRHPLIDRALAERPGDIDELPGEMAVCTVPVKEMPEAARLKAIAKPGGKYLRVASDDILKVVVLRGPDAIVAEAVEGLKGLIDPDRLEVKGPEKEGAEEAEEEAEEEASPVAAAMIRRVDFMQGVRLLKHFAADRVAVSVRVSSRAVLLEGKPQAVEWLAALARQLDGEVHEAVRGAIGEPGAQARDESKE